MSNAKQSMVEILPSADPVRQNLQSVVQTLRCLLRTQPTSKLRNYLGLLLFAAKSPDLKFSTTTFLVWVSSQRLRDGDVTINLLKDRSVAAAVSDLRDFLKNKACNGSGSEKLVVLSAGTNSWRLGLPGQAAATSANKSRTPEEQPAKEKSGTETMTVERMAKVLGFETLEKSRCAIVAFLANLDGAVWPSCRGPIHNEYRAALKKLTDDPGSYRLICRDGSAELLGYTSIWRTQSGLGKTLLKSSAKSGNVSLEKTAGHDPLAVLEPQPNRAARYDGVVTGIKLHPSWRAEEKSIGKLAPRRHYLVRAVADLLMADALRNILYDRLYIRFSHADDEKYFLKPEVCGSHAKKLIDFHGVSQPDFDTAYRLDLTDDVLDLALFSPLKRAYLRPVFGNGTRVVDSDKRHVQARSYART